MITYRIIAPLIALILLFASCSDDPASVDTEGPGESELITRVTLELEELDAEDNPTGNVFTAVWEDADGPGGEDPTVQELELTNGTNYSGSIELLDTTDDPPEDITEEVKEEDEEHQFFYEFRGSGIQIERLDTDGNGFKLGLDFRVEVQSDATNGDLNVTLLHFEDAEKNSDDFPSDQTGIDTDVDIDIPVVF